MSYIDYVLAESSPFLDDFITRKVDDICNHITLFYNYLSIPRDGFKIVKKPFWIGTTKCIKILNDYEKKKLKVNTMRCERPIVNKFFCELHSNAKLEDNITSEIVSTKRINKEMVVYLFNDIYNCKNFTSTTNLVEFVGRERQTIFSEIYKAIDQRFTKSSIKDVLYSHLNDYEIIIENDVENLITKYVAICIYNMIFIDLKVDSLYYKYSEMQKFVLDYKKDYIDYDLEDEKYNIGLQAFVYIITALMDWLETDEVTIDEVETAFNMILYSSYKRNINSIININNKNIQTKLNEPQFSEKIEKYKSNVSLAFKNLNLYADEDVSFLILKYVLLLSNIFYLDETCQLYSSTEPALKELFNLLNKVFIGCYDFSFPIDDKGHRIIIKGKMNSNYIYNLKLRKDIDSEKFITITFRPYYERKRLDVEYITKNLDVINLMIDSSSVSEYKIENPYYKLLNSYGVYIKELFNSLNSAFKYLDDKQSKLRR